MRTKNLCILIHVRIMYKPSSDFFTDHSKTVLLLGTLFVIMFHFCLYYIVLSVPCCLVITCWERADLLALLCGVSLCFCHFPIWCLESDVVLDSINSCSLHSSLIFTSTILCIFSCIRISPFCDYGRAPGHTEAKHVAGISHLMPRSFNFYWVSNSW